MKHLKRFNESISVLDKEEVREFCETRLAYLLDDGYEIHIRKDLDSTLVISFNLPSNKFGLSIRTSLNLDEDFVKFKWNDIKDYFIPFLTHLSNNYEINGKVQFAVNRLGCKTYYFYNTQQIIDDQPTKLDYHLYEIEIIIK